MKKGRVLVGMSGGLDSSVAAVLLLEQGYDVVGAYMNLWADPTPFHQDERKNFPQNKCCSIESLMFARSICQKLGVPFYSINFEAEFKENVVDYFLEGHRSGETPNPCVRCNKTVKFGIFFKKMQELGCDYLATGHYAKLIRDEEGLVHLHRGKDESKDQTYFLYNLAQNQLQQLLFPIGDFSKDEVRAIAKKHDLKELEGKPESQGVCFYPEKTYMPFLDRYLKAGEDYSSGEIQDEMGQKLGTHTGLPFYTIGQRKGIGVGGGPALYVNKVDRIKNVLIVGSEEELYAPSVRLREVNFLSGVDVSEEELLEMRIRHGGKLAHGTIKKIPNSAEYEVIFQSPQRAVMAGQSLVFYRDGELLGGGIMAQQNAFGS